MYNIESFFETIYEKCSNDEEKVIELLRARGFLIDKVGDTYVLSDNSHKIDGSYLNKLLEKYNIGRMRENIIVFDNVNMYKELENEFKAHNRIGYETLILLYGWDYFARRICGYKVPVECLEPFIARYVKAVSSAGLITSQACDGNHNGLNRLFVKFAGMPSYVWHEIIGEVLENRGISLCWNGAEIRWHNDDEKFRTYTVLNQAADYIYSNRMLLREIKRAPFIGCSKSRIRNMDEIEMFFKEKTTVLLKENKLL